MLLKYILKDNNPASEHICDTCGQSFVLCPQVEISQYWPNCLWSECGSYDQGRDIELLISEDGYISRDELQNHPKYNFGLYTVEKMGIERVVTGSVALQVVV